jgi:F-type H+-transporting ATPase subunit a
MSADPAELIGHVKDTTAPHSFHLPRGIHIDIPQPLEAFGIEITKFMVLELVAAVLLLAVFLPVARKISTGQPVKGKFWNLIEFFLLFLRDEVARPAIGRKDADRFLPFIWTIFFFVLFCNLLGMIPWAGSPTGSLSCTGVLAMITFCVVTGAGMKKFGPVGFWIGQVPHMEVPLVMGIFIKPMIFLIEVFGMIIKHAVLSVRLLANMFAGHMVLGAMLGFIAMTADSHVALWSSVTVASLFGATAISLLELFVAFLQAYIFTFLSALFIGMAIHQH